MRRARRGADPGRHQQVSRSTGKLSAFRPYLGEGGKKSRQKDWLIGAVCLLLALVLIFLPNANRENIASAVRGTLLRPVFAMQRGAVERSAFFDSPVRLRAQRDSLAAFLVGQATLAAENRQLRELLGLKERLPRSFVPAEVVRIPGRGTEGFFQLTAGSDQGVALGASIVSAGGLVGRVTHVDRDIAFGIDWMNSDFRAAAMTVEGDIYGIVEPRTLEGEPLLALTGTPRHVELDAGVVIVTSGHGGVYPRGIPIGTVVGQEGGETGWQRNYIVRPLVAPSEMNYVLVLGEPELTLQGQDLALSWGIRPVEPIPEVEEAFEASLAPPPPPPPPPPPRQEGPRLLGEPVQPPQN